MKEKKKNVREKILNIVLNTFIVVFGIILLFSIYNNVQVSIFGKDYSDFFGYSIFEVQTGSMKPEIDPGDWILVKSSQNIKLDDIITYKQDGEFITHRVIGVYNNTFITKGDANNSKDDPIDQKQVVGKVVKILPHFGILKKTIFNPIVLVAIITTILVSNYVLKKNKKEVKEEEIKREKIIVAEKTDKEEVIDELIEEKVETKKEKIGLLNKLKEKLSKNKKQKIEEQIIEENKNENFSELTIIEDDDLGSKTEEELNEMFEEISSYIPVDASEIDETFLEIAQNEIDEEAPAIEIKPVVEEEEEEEIEESPNKLNLELLETGKKSKNIIEKFISVKMDEIKEIINILDNDGKTYVNEPTIKNKLMCYYIDAKYYNYYGDLDVSSLKKQIDKIEKYIDSSSELLKKKYTGSDTKYSEKVDKFLNIIKTIARLELANISISDRKAKEEYYKNELTNYSKISGWDISEIKTSISEILKIQRNYVGIVEYLCKKFETNMFKLEINKLKTNKKMFAVDLEHNITFGKLYSDYIIDKTYSEGVIAENKIIILLNLLSINLIRDMIASDFDKKYILYFPETIYSKSTKLDKLLSMIEDEHAKESVIILTDINGLNANKVIIRKLKKAGYKFGLAIANESTLETRNATTTALVDYIFVDKNMPNIIKIAASLPDDVADKLVYENVIDKISDFGGEEEE